MNEEAGLELSGLDGGNPLGFLAALGTLRVATLAFPNVRPKLCWIPKDLWKPVLFACGNDKDQFIDVLFSKLNAVNRKPFSEQKKMPFSAKLFFDLARKACSVSNPRDREVADFVAALGSEAIPDKNGDFVDTAFRMVRSGDSAGQGFFHYVNMLRETTGQEMLKRALFETWDYRDEGYSLRWDTYEDQRYALGWENPSSTPTRSMRGANRLAIEALPLFPTSIQGTNLKTTGFKGSGSRNTYWTWPIWELPVSIDTVRSLLSLQTLQADSPDRKYLCAMGVAEVYRSQRLTIGKYYRNFTPAEPV